MPLKEASAVMVPLPAASSKTVPWLAHRQRRRAVEVALRVTHQAGKWIAPVGAVEVGERGDGAAAGGQLEDRAQPVGPTETRRAVEVALRVTHQAGMRTAPVGAVERGKRGDGAAAGGQLEDRAQPVGPTGTRRAVEVALRVTHQAGSRTAPLVPLKEARRGDGAAAGGQLEDRAQPVGPTETRRAVEVALRVTCQAGSRIDPVGAVEEARR